jgi:pimeloyl-ACP methyl ester carboxylesterase
MDVSFVRFDILRGKQHNPAMPEFTRDGLTFHYETRGDPAAPAVVLLHGYTSDLRSWHEHMEALCGDYFVIAPDMRGHGTSAAPEELSAYAIQEFAEDLRALLDELKVDQCAVVGCSFGGMVALQFATTWPERLAALVLSDTSPAYESERYHEDFRIREQGMDANEEVVRKMGTAELGKRAAANVKDPFLGAALKKRYSRMSREGFIGGAHARRSRPNLIPLLTPKLTMPVMLVTGDNDPVRSAFDVMREELPAARAITFRDTAHGVPMLRPEPFLKQLYEFFEAVEDDQPVAGQRTV